MALWPFTGRYIFTSLETTHGQIQNHRLVDTNTVLFITVCFWLFLFFPLCLTLPLCYSESICWRGIPPPTQTPETWGEDGSVLLMGKTVKPNNVESFTLSCSRIRQNRGIKQTQNLNNICLSYTQMLTIMFVCVLFLWAHSWIHITHKKAHIMAPLTNNPEKTEGPSMTYFKPQTLYGCRPWTTSEITLSERQIVESKASNQWVKERLCV